jgi:3-oxoacyl-[acyl-carrier protein] reductase
MTLFTNTFFKSYFFCPILYLFRYIGKFKNHFFDLFAILYLICQKYNETIMKLLEGKTAIITGAARGIGKSIAVRFAQEGANVAFTDLRLDENTSILEKELEAYGIRAIGYASDASKYAETEMVVDNIFADFGKVDILVNNAGITMDTLLMRMSEQQWDTVINVNLKSVFNFTKAVQKIMLKAKKGSIVNLSSVVGVHGNAGQANYSASKAGIIGFTKSIAQELGSRNIRCNAVAPGFIITEMTAKLSEEVKKRWEEGIPMKRGGTPEEVANVCLFLGSDLSSYVSGQVISICGAMKT